MSFVQVNVLNDHVKSFLTPQELVRIDLVAKPKQSNSGQWKKLGYENKNECRKIVQRVTSLRSQLLKGEIDGSTAKDIEKIPMLSLRRQVS